MLVKCKNNEGWGNISRGFSLVTLKEEMIAALQETRRGEGITESKYYDFHCSGYENGMNGVAFALDKSLRGSFKIFINKKYPDRIIIFKCEQCTVINIYHPTNEYSEEDKDNFQSEMKAVLKAARKDYRSYC